VRSPGHRSFSCRFQRHPVLALAVCCGCFAHDVDRDTQGSDENNSGLTDSGSDADADSDVDTDTDADLGDVFGVPNIDDDDLDGSADWFEDGLAKGENDFSQFEIPASVTTAVPSGHRLDLVLDGAGEEIRLWYQGNVVLGDASAGTVGSWAVPLDQGSVPLEVEWATFLSEGDVTLRESDSAGTTVRSDSYRLLAAPYVQSHHGLDMEHLWAVRVAGWGMDNAAFIDVLAKTLGPDFTSVDGNFYDYDVWIQDEFEWGTLTSASHRVDVILDSVRNRGIDRYDENVLLAPDVAIVTHGSFVGSSSYDYFGNLEVTPPFSAGGVDYPFGRLYWGASDSYAPEEQLTDFLQAQEIQAPITLDTSWLCVGHVDEFVTFIPDPDSLKGFRMAITDVDAAYALLDGLDPDWPIDQYSALDGYSTVGDLVGDSALRALNETVQSDDLDPLREQLMLALDLTDDDVIRVPGLWEEPRGCGRHVAALIPGIVNMAVAGEDADSPYLFIADPFLRASDAPQSEDPLIAELDGLWPAGAQPVYVDDWDVYHEMLGEVHCGTMVRRTPVDDWWVAGLDLVGGAR
jgi:hypothetical protein